MTSKEHLDRLKEEIAEATEVPDFDDDDDEDPSKVFQEVLAEGIAVVREALSRKANDAIDNDDWAEFLRAADEAFTGVWQHAREMELFQGDAKLSYSNPVDNGDVLKARGWAGLKMFLALPDLLVALGLGDPEDPRVREAYTRMSPVPWKDLQQYRPSQDSHLLARFRPAYNKDRIAAVLSELKNTHAELLPALQPALNAHIDIRDDRIGNPVAIAIAGDIVGISQAGGWKERKGYLGWYKTGPNPRTSPYQDTDEFLKAGDTKRCGFSGPASQLVGDGNILWAAGDCRIKGYDAATQKPIFTLNSTDYEGKFGVSGDFVFRADGKGKLAVWQRSALTQHAPYLATPYSEIPQEGRTPFGGWLSPDVMGWQDMDTKLEVSAGQSPTSILTVNGTSGSFGTLAKVPNSSRWLFSLRQGNNGPQRSGAIKSFDLAQPTSSAQILGLGGPSAFEHIATHDVVPDFFVAAGDDPIARVYDYRTVLPQLVLDGHDRSLGCCIIAPYGGQYPLVFTGGSDELVKAWDIRHTKACLYDLSVGTLPVLDMAWHEGSNSLWVVGQNFNEDRMGGLHGFRSLASLRKVCPVPGLLGEPADDENDEDISWPSAANTWPTCFGKPWAASCHSVIQYRFVNGAPADQVPMTEYIDASDSDDGFAHGSMW